jgi:hypothetical protein
VRFGRVDAVPDEFVLADVESLPTPDGHSPETYAAELGVPTLDPRRPVGTIHLFYVLRDELNLLYSLMEDWRITTLGQLEGLLRSNTAREIFTDDNIRERLASRCTIARTWISTWNQGRGRTVDRIALERSGAVSGTFMERVSDLADDLNGDGAALIEALKAGNVSRFREERADELEEWLQAEGYIDQEETLIPADRERRTLLDAAGQATPDDIRQVVRWLEAGSKEPEVAE